MTQKSSQSRVTNKSPKSKAPARKKIAGKVKSAADQHKLSGQIVPTSIAAATGLEPRGSAAELRSLCRSGAFAGQTSGRASGCAQANLVILPAQLAFDFLLFCQRNPKPCPVLEVLEPGVFLTSKMANGADIRTDLPKS